jgi:hypothetical protein
VRGESGSRNDLLAEAQADGAFERELLVSETTETLRALMSELSLTQRDLARRLGVSDARLSRVMSGQANLTLGTLAEIGWAVGMRFEVVVVPLEDRSRTPAADDPPPPRWILQHARLVAARVCNVFQRSEPARPLT